MDKLKFHVIIPARYASSRLPGKALLDIGGKPMIGRVVECARRSAAASVTVATDDRRIARIAGEFGAQAVMTSRAHRCGAERVCEAAAALGLADDEIIVNVQGDEPDMPAALIDQVAQLLAQKPRASMATASAPLDAAQLQQPSVVKVAADRDGYALFFSRAAIAAESARRHLGIYAYRRAYLRRFAALGECELERGEQLEQLRALWNGDTIACADALAAPSAGVDTRAGLERVRRDFA
ncbi:MAG: 3-deoxy-manno-octulosonate cytidylyltransferase [Gammaproteobacteria bacterium]